MPVSMPVIVAMIVAMIVTVFAVTMLVRFVVRVPVIAAVRMRVLVAVVWWAGQRMAVPEVARRLAHVLYSTHNDGVAQPGRISRHAIPGIP